MTDIDEAFESPLILLRSAKRNLAKFKREMVKDYKRLKIKYVADETLQTRLRVHRLSVIGRPSEKLRDLGTIIVNHCRHALDQMVVASTALLGGTEMRDIYFPFVQDEGDFDRYIGNSKRYKNMDAKLFPVLRELQPWWRDPNGGNTGDDVLRTLAALAGPNKHQVIIDFAPKMLGFGAKELTFGTALRFFPMPVRSDHIEDGIGSDLPIFKGRTDFIFALTFAGDSDRVVKPTAQFAYCVSEATRFRYKPADVLLEQFVQRTDHAVNRIKAFVLDEVVP